MPTGQFFILLYVLPKILHNLGTKEMQFTANGDYTEDVTVYASADITVDLPDGNEEAY